MILIFSKSKSEYSTNAVIDWLIKKKRDFLRFNGDSIRESDFSFLSVNNEPDRLDIGGNKQFLSEVKSVWYRRWTSFDFFLPYKKVTDDFQTNTEIKKHLAYELETIRSFFPQLMNQSNWLGNPKSAAVNKIEVLSIAKSLDIDYPDTLITNSRSDLKKFFERCSQDIIVKSLSEIGAIRYNEKSYFGYTVSLEGNDIEELPNLFFPTLFQRNIEKEFELRIFYLDTEFFSMAIFSQSDEQTTTDFRLYNRKNPNRNVPFKLPVDVENKLIGLMKEVGLNCGSIDMIKGKDDKYYFLEVNPIGQFGMVSNPCNYYLEEKVADYLIKHDR